MMHKRSLFMARLHKGYKRVSPRRVLLFTHPHDTQRRYAFQYHAEINEPLLRAMCHNEADYMSANGFDAETVIDQGRTYLAEVMARDRVVLGRWIDKLNRDA
jgi:hypothetical protein